MLVSIIIVTYNSSRFIQRCLETLLSHTTISHEIIVYDNASFDKTQDIISKDFPSVRLICGNSNIGFASANNAATKAASGQVLVFLNPDVYLTERWLEPLIGALDLEDDIGATTPMILFADHPETINACGNNIHASGVAYCNDYGRQYYDDYPYQIGAISGAAFAIRRTLFDEIGGFESTFFMYYEDTDLSLRLQCAGYSIVVVPESKVLHDYYPVFSPEKTYYLERNRYLSIFSIVSWQMLIVMLAAIVVSEIGSWTYCFTQGRQAILSKAYAWREIIQRRHWIRERRQLLGFRNCQSNLGSVFIAEMKIDYVSENMSLLVNVYEKICLLSAMPVNLIGYLNRLE